jgi:hypothetical protein
MGGRSGCSLAVPEIDETLDGPRWKRDGGPENGSEGHARYCCAERLPGRMRSSPSLGSAQPGPDASSSSLHGFTSVAR